jgi:cytochrome c6
MAVAFAFSFLLSAGQNTEGEKIYAGKCAVCHAKDGSGSTARGKTLKVPDLRSPEIQQKTDDELIKGILKAKGHPPYEKQLGDEGLRNVVLFMRTFKSK